MTTEQKIDPEFQKLLDISVNTHGHLCPGQVLGVRMSMLGLNLISIKDPKGKDRKKFIVYVEIDRCATDAIQSVTGVTLGKRSLKFVDLGKMAATYVNTETGKAVRILAKEDARDKAKNYFPDIEDKYKAQLEAYKIMPDEDLFELTDVTVDITKEDMPGRPLQRIKCEQCGEHVQDMREMNVGGRLVCKSCGEGSYYKAL